MNFSITSGEQSLQVFTATLILSPFCLINTQKDSDSAYENEQPLCTQLSLSMSLWSQYSLLIYVNIHRRKIHLHFFCKLHRRLPRRNPHQEFVQERSHFGQSHTSPLKNKKFQSSNVSFCMSYSSKDMHSNFLQTWSWPFIEDLTVDIGACKYKQTSWWQTVFAR